MAASRGCRLKPAFRSRWERRLQPAVGRRMAPEELSGVHARGILSRNLRGFRNVLCFKHFGARLSLYGCRPEKYDKNRANFGFVPGGVL